MKARTPNMWRLARLHRRLSHTQQQLRIWKRSKRGGNKCAYVIDYFVGTNHHEPVHEAKQAALKTVAAKREQPDRLGPANFTALPDLSVLALAARAKRKRRARRVEEE